MVTNTELKGDTRSRNPITKVFHKVYWEFFRKVGDTELDDRVKVYIISHPKCGRTWLRMLIGKAICDKFNLSEEFILDTVKLTGMAGLAGVGWTHEHSGDLRPSLTGNRFVRFATDKSTFQNKKVIFLCRDPKDVLVSFYFHTEKRANKKAFEGNISEFIRSRRFGITKLIEYYNVWYKNQEVPEDFLLIKYEDLHRDPHKTMKLVLEFIGVNDIETEIIDDAVKFSSFSNMKKMEKNKEIKYKNMQPGNVNDDESYKVRKGKVSGYLDYLSQEDIQYIDKVVAKMGCPFIGIYR